MLDSQLITPLVTTLAVIFTPALIILAIAMAWMHLHFRRNAKMNEAVSYLDSYIAYSKGDPVTLLAMLANALSGQDQVSAIWHLASLATLNNNPDAFLALRDHISANDLRRTLKSWCGGDLKGYIAGNPSIGQLNGKKLICFIVGMRTIEHLDTELTAAEHKMLRDRFGIHQPLEVVESEAG